MLLKRVFAQLEWSELLLCVPDLEGAREELGRRQDVAVILLDRHLGEHSGLDLLDWMRAEGHQVPALVHSWSNEPDMIQAAYLRGASGFVSKPQGLEPLKSMVRAIKHFWVDLNLAP